MSPQKIGQKNQKLLSKKPKKPKGSLSRKKIRALLVTPYYKRSPQPLITSAFKNVFLQTLQTYLRLQAALAHCLEIAVAPQMTCWTIVGFFGSLCLNDCLTTIPVICCEVCLCLLACKPKKFRAFGPKIFNELPLGRSSKMAKNAIGSLPTHKIAALVLMWS